MKHIDEEIPSFCVHFVSLDEPGTCLPPKYLQHLLSEVKPGTLSLPAQKALCPGLRRSCPIVHLQRIFEHFMDLGSNKMIPDSWRRLSDMTVGLKTFTKSRASAGGILVPPVDWQVTGFYSLLSEGGKYFIPEKNNGGKVFF